MPSNQYKKKTLCEFLLLNQTLRDIFNQIKALSLFQQIQSRQQNSPSGNCRTVSIIHGLSIISGCDFPHFNSHSNYRISELHFVISCCFPVRVEQSVSGHPSLAVPNTDFVIRVCVINSLGNVDAKYNKHVAHNKICHIQFYLSWNLSLSIKLYQTTYIFFT